MMSMLPLRSTQPILGSLSFQANHRLSPMSSEETYAFFSAGRPAQPDGPCQTCKKPEPGGWNRIHLIVADIEAEVDRLHAKGVRFRNDVVRGPGGAQILVEDPSGNVVELVQPAS